MTRDGYVWTNHPLVGWCWYRTVTAPRYTPPPEPAQSSPARQPAPPCYEGPNGEQWNSTRYHEVWTE